MNPNLFVILLDVAGTLVNIVATLRRIRAAQSVGMFITMIAVAMAVINQI